MLRHDTLWWTMPGPEEFPKFIEDDLRAGRNVVVPLPQFAPSGLRAVVSERIQRTELYSFRTLDLAEVEPSVTDCPSRLLHDQFAHLPPGVEPTPQSLAKCSKLSETVVWISGVGEQNWEVWRRFLELYKDACRDVAVHERLLFVVPVVGIRPNDSPQADIALSVRPYRNTVGRLDMWLFTWHLLRTSSTSALYRDLAVAIVSEIAGIDPCLAETLAAARLEDQLNPGPLLRDFAKERNWDPDLKQRQTDLTEEDEWRLGLSDLRDGTRLLHSAAAVDQQVMLRKRVWRGQMTVLFPFLEDIRTRFIHQYRSLLSVPVNTEWETISDIDSLEIAHLVYQLGRKIGRDSRADLDACRRIRNELAHLRPLSAEELLSPAVKRLTKRVSG